MSKEYKVKVKYDIGDEVWIIRSKEYDQKKPEVIVGKIRRITIIINEGSEPVPTYKVAVATSWRPEEEYYELDLLSESEAKKRYKLYCERLRSFDDTFLKTQIEKARQLIKAYEK